MFYLEKKIWSNKGEGEIYLLQMLSGPMSPLIISKTVPETLLEFCVKISSVILVLLNVTTTQGAWTNVV